MKRNPPPGLSHMSKELEEEVFAPRSELHFSGEGSSVGMGSQYVEGDASNDGKVLWSIILAGSRIVLVEDNVERPMEVIFDPPMQARYVEHARR